MLVACGLGCGPVQPPERSPQVQLSAPTAGDASPRDGTVTDQAPTRPADVSPTSVPSEPPTSTTPQPRSSLRERASVVDRGATSGLVAFVGELPPGGLTWVGPLAGNGGRDVLVHVPAPVRPNADIELVYHFHGTHSERVAKQQPGMEKKQWVGWDRVQQTLDAVTELHGRSANNVALVYPLSAGKRADAGHVGWFNKEYDRQWMRADASPPESLDALHEQVRDVMAKHFDASPGALASRVIAEGHSAGGLPLFHIAASGTALVGEYIFLDASFQSWADGCYRASRESTAPGNVTVVITKGGIADAFAPRDPWCKTTRDDAAAWVVHREACEGGAKKLTGTKRTCDQLRIAADDWPAQGPWCAALEPGAAALPGMFVLYTKVPHGKQPRHFVGGLELPADRWTK